MFRQRFRSVVCLDHLDMQALPPSHHNTAWITQREELNVKPLTNAFNVFHTGILQPNHEDWGWFLFSFYFFFYWKLTGTHLAVSLVLHSLSDTLSLNSKLPTKKSENMTAQQHLHVTSPSLPLSPRESFFMLTLQAGARCFKIKCQLASISTECCWWFPRLAVDPRPDTRRRAGDHRASHTQTGSSCVEDWLPSVYVCVCVCIWSVSAYGFGDCVYGVWVCVLGKHQWWV